MITTWLSKSGDRISSQRRLSSRLSAFGCAFRVFRSNTLIIPFSS
ncbi:hypothetical protein LINPERHAP2_LOCUS8395 [Linum perenne]